MACAFHCDKWRVRVQHIAAPWVPNARISGRLPLWRLYCSVEFTPEVRTFQMAPARRRGRCVAAFAHTRFPPPLRAPGGACTGEPREAPT